ncbi:MAG: glycosyltransferase family A protein, partial [Sphingomonadales bacterium]
MSEASAGLRMRREALAAGVKAAGEESVPTAQQAVQRRDRWSIVIPFYNEAPVIGATLESICRQTRPFRLILVDNGSDDGGAEVCRKILDRAGADYRILDESRAGQVHALACGIAAVETELVAIMDADVHYPAHYLEVAESLFDARGEETVATSAYFVPPEATPLRAALAAAHQLLAA